jgi:hypothetical protein
MRKIHILTACCLAAMLGSACSSPSGPPADRIVYRTSSGVGPSLDSMNGEVLLAVAPASPAGDISEKQRIEFHERWGQRERFVPPKEPSEPPPRLEKDYSYLWWAIPLTLAAGYGIYRTKRHYDRHDYHYHY